MKLTTAFLLAACLSASAKGLSQEVTLSEKNVSLNQIFKEINRQTGYTFVYTESLLEKGKSITINVRNASIEQVLELCFKDQPLTYTILNKMVVVKEKPSISRPDVAENVAPPGIKITGKITNDISDPLSGASVAEKGTNNIAIAKEDGSFEITVAGEKSILLISYVGYESKEISLGNQTTISIKLNPANQALSDIVVVGYGTAKKKDLTGAVASVSSKDFNKGNYATADQLIQGKMSGVQIINNNGQPGNTTTIKIRGNSAMTGTGQPLFVLDGVPLDGRSLLANTNPLNFINPADIASIDVLKDASATAIYGSRAAYGVVIINTKKGQAGITRIEANVTNGVSTIARKIKVLNAQQYRQAITYYNVSPLSDKGGNADALDAITQTGIQQNYNLAVSGGNETGKYRVSLGILDQDGIVRKTGLKKYSAGLATNFKFLESKKLGLDLNVNGSQSLQDIPYTASAPYGLFFAALQWNPTDSLKKADGSFNIRPSGSNANPLALTELQKENLKTSTILASISPYYKFNNWLEYRLQMSINYSSGIRRTSTNQALVPNLLTGAASIGNSELTTQQITHTLSFNKEISPNITLSALAGYEYMKFKMKGFSMSATGRTSTGGFGNYGLDYTNYIQYSDANGRIITSFVDPLTELQSFFGRTMVNLKEKYLLTATIRADGSSKFGKNNRYGYFPSFSAAWVVSNEKFFKPSFVNSFKIRAGWGKTGNQEFPSGASQAKYSFLNNGVIGQVNNPNPDLKWQSDEQYNVGVDFTILHNRVSATIDYFHKTTTDLLFPSFPVQPSSPGSVVRWINLDGNIINKGVEVAINSALIDHSDFSLELGVNATFLKNTVSNFPTAIQTGRLEGLGVTGALIEIMRNGLPANAFYTRKYLGMDKGTGRPILVDDGTTSYYVGDPNPNMLLGVSSTLRYKKLSLVVNMNGVFGNDIFNSTNLNIINVGGINAGRNIALDIYKAPVKESLFNNVTASSRYIEKGNYLRMSNLTLSYNIGDVAKAFKRANVFVTGQNLFIITKYSGFDPEVNVDRSLNGVPSLGIDYAQYPSARTILIGLNFSL